MSTHNYPLTNLTLSYGKTIWTVSILFPTFHSSNLDSQFLFYLIIHPAIHVVEVGICVIKIKVIGLLLIALLLRLLLLFFPMWYNMNIFANKTIYLQHKCWNKYFYIWLILILAIVIIENLSCHHLVVIHEVWVRASPRQYIQYPRNLFISITISLFSIT